MSSCSGVWATAPSTPNPPALVTAATTSRQWLNARMGNSTPSMSVTLVFTLPPRRAPCERRPVPPPQPQPMRTARILLGGLVLGLGLGACGAGPAPAKPAAGATVTIGSLDTPQQVVVANLYAQVLAHAGARVILHADSGTRATVEPALASGRIDLYPDDVGELLLFLDANDGAAATHLATAVGDIRGVLAAAGATVLEPAPALDAEVFVVTRATAQQYHLTTLSSLAPVAAKLVLGGPPGCPSQPQCGQGLQNTYGLHFKSFTSLDEAGPVTVSALGGGEVQIAPLSSSDGTVASHGFAILGDDKHLLNADDVVPVIRASVATRPVTAALDRLSARLTTDQLAQLTIEVTVDHEAPGAVARRWLEHEHLI